MAQQIIVVLSTELGIPPQSIVAAMRDRASVNDVAMGTIKVTEPLSMMWRWGLSK